MYGFMLLVFLILTVVSTCITVVGTYFLLNAENYHWPWTSFAMSATSAAYVFLYSVRQAQRQRRRPAGQAWPQAARQAVGR